MLSSSRKLFFLLTILSLFVQPLFAVEHSDYRLFGKVVDVKGNGIGGVKIILKDVETGKGVTITSKADGTFDQAFIQHAIYTVSFEKEGYIPKKIDKLDLSATAEQQIEKKIDVQLATPEEMKEYEMQKGQVDMEKKIGETYKKAIEMFQNKQFDQAISSMQEVLKSAPSTWGAYHVIGVSYYMKKDCDNALANLQKSVELKKDNSEAYALMGDCYVQKKDWNKAIDSYQTDLANNPADLEVQCVIADLYRATGKEAEAEAAVSKAMQSAKSAEGTVDPKVGVCYRVNGEILLKKGDMKGSIASLKKYLELNPAAWDKAQVTEMIQALEQTK
jgi:tetratricopeptide (TPR) repeat protein